MSISGFSDFEIAVTDTEEQFFAAESEDVFHSCQADTASSSSPDLETPNLEDITSMPRRSDPQPGIVQPPANARATRNTIKTAEEFAAGPSRSTRGARAEPSQTTSVAPRPPRPTSATAKKKTANTTTSNKRAVSKTDSAEPNHPSNKRRKQQDAPADKPAPAEEPMDVDQPPAPPAAAPTTRKAAKPKQTKVVILEQQPLQEPKRTRRSASSETTLAESISKNPSPPRAQATQATTATTSKPPSPPATATVATAADTKTQPSPKASPARQQKQKQQQKTEAVDVEQEQRQDSTGIATPPKLTADAPSPKRNSPRNKTTTKSGTTDSDAAAASTWWNPLEHSKVHAARDVLQCAGAETGEIPLCRERQAAAVTSWLTERLTTHTGGSMYISGPPGTGKSLTAAEVVKKCSTVGVGAKALVSVNCMSLTDPRQVVLRILTACRTARANLLESGGVKGAAAGKGSRGKKVAPPAAAKQPPPQSPTIITAGDESDAMLWALGGSDPLQLLKKEVLYNGGASTSKTGAGGGNRRASGGTSNTTSGGSGKTQQQQQWTQNQGMIVVILDEMDGLLGSGRSGNELLGDLFALAHSASSALVLVGLANSIDLVQQLTRIGGALHRRSISPKHVIFPSYLRLEISRLLNQRLATLPGPVFQPNAIEFCARKVSNGNGDMRLALEACSQALETLVADAKTTADKAAEAAAAAATTSTPPGSTKKSPGGVLSPSKSGGGLKSPINSKKTQAAAAALQATTVPTTVGMRQMAAALNSVTGGIGVGSGTVTAIKGLPVPQQLLLCVLSDAVNINKKAAAAANSNTNRFISVKKPTANKPTSGAGTGTSNGNGGSYSDALTIALAAEKHTTLCRRLGIEVFAINQLSTVVDILQDLGLVKVHRVMTNKGGTKDRRQGSVSLNVSVDDVLLALADVPVVKDVLARQQQLQQHQQQELPPWAR